MFYLTPSLPTGLLIFLMTKTALNSTFNVIFFPDIEILFAGNSDCNEDEVRDLLNWKREEMTDDQMLKAEETFDQMSNSSRNGNSEDDLYDILNIPKDDLLDANSPERPDDIPQEHSEEELQMDSLNTPVVMPDLATLWGGSSTQVVRSKQNVILPQRNGGFIQTDSTNYLKTFKDEDFSPSTGPPEDGLRSRHANRVQNKTTNVAETVENSTAKTDLAQLLMVFTVFFILLLCVVQISSNSLGLPLTTLPLIGITSVLSLGIVGAKFAKV